MVSEASVQEYLTMKLWAFRQQSTSWQEGVVKETFSIHDSQVAKRETGGSQGTHVPFEDTPQIVQLLSYLLQFPPPPNSTMG